MMATRLNVTNTTELRKNGINALKTALGVTGTLKFLEQFDNGGSETILPKNINTKKPNLPMRK